MSELIQKNDNCATIRWKLLTSVSAAALAISSITAARAEDGDHPLVWIELGGQLEQLSDSQEALSPPFMSSITQSNLLKALDVQQQPKYLIGDTAKITFLPEDSDWAFSASIQYGRTGANRHHHQQTANKAIPVHFHFLPPFSAKYIGPKYYYPSRFAKFADGQSNLSQKNLVLDFQAGKDVGLGLFGGRGSSVVSAGVRIAQFTSKSDVTLRADPDLQYPTAPVTSKYEFIAFRSNQRIHFHNYVATASSDRSFRGLGPSLAWNASIPVAGNAQDGEITLDWGVNAAMLFGRQTARGHHRTATKAYYLTSWGGGLYQYQKSGRTIRQGHFRNRYFETEGGAVLPTAQHTNAPAPFNRVRNVTVPNLGGFAGLSMRYSDVKFSIGYKADFFFNAIDGGIDTRKNEDRGFYGPFASISIGIGD